MKKNKGFTLIEVMVVIVILGIITAVVAPIIPQFVAKAKQGQKAAEMKKSGYSERDIQKEVEKLSPKSDFILVSKYEDIWFTMCKFRDIETNAYIYVCSTSRGVSVCIK